jgi:SAM-dependent methyltransferase
MLGRTWRRDPEAGRRFRQRVTRVLRPVWLGSLRRPTPVSQKWGYDRGTPVDRYYIEQFLQRHQQDIRGRVLEIKDSRYTRRFGVDVSRSDVLDIDGANRQATIVADLGIPDSLPADAFDCCLVVQTLNFVMDLPAAVTGLWRALRPGGVLLVTVPGITRIDPVAAGQDCWRFTPLVCRRLFAERFGDAQVEAQGRGNVLASIGFLTGMAQEEFTRRELDAADDAFPLIVTIRAVKRAEPARA